MASRPRQSGNNVGGGTQRGNKGAAAVVLGVFLISLAPTAALAQGDGSQGGEQPVASDDSTTTSTTAGSGSDDATSTSTTIKDSSESTQQPADTDNTDASAGQASSTTVPERQDQTGGNPSTTSEEGGKEGEDTSDSTLDPLVGEAPTDETLDPNLTVPPPTGAADNVDFAPVPVLWGNVRQAEEKWASALSAKVSAVAEVRSMRLRMKELSQQQQTLEGETQQTIEDLIAATKRLQDRAVRGFVQISSGNPDSPILGAGPEDTDTDTDAGNASNLFRGRDIVLSQRKARMIQAVVAVDQTGLGHLAALRESLGSTATELVKRQAVVGSSLRKAELAAGELGTDIDQAKIELEAFKAGSEIYVDGVVFPIGGPYSVPLIDSFGFPRMPGTTDAHSHEGIDIFAPRGTPLVAAERGIIGRVGNGRLGGLKFWLRGESGADWYYAHLDGFVPGFHNGQVVEAGELLGYVGNTGNAVGTPPHLHVEIHPDGGHAVNPYPLLKIVSDLDLNSFVEGTHPGFRYQAVVRPQSEEDTTTTTGVVDEDPATTTGDSASVPSGDGTGDNSPSPSATSSTAPSTTTPTISTSSPSSTTSATSTSTTSATDRVTESTSETSPSSTVASEADG